MNEHMVAEHTSLTKNGLTSYHSEGSASTITCTTPLTLMST